MNPDVLFWRLNRSLTDRREHLAVLFTPYDELHGGGHPVIADDVHNQHDDAAWQTANVERASRQVISGLASRHTVDDCKDIA